jgi:hypothetical protein
MVWSNTSNVARCALVAFLACLATDPVAAETYDYFRNARYPGTLREDVGLDQVEQATDADGRPGRPGRRVVQWWPKQGVDVVDIPEGVPLRTWTIRTPEEEPLVEFGHFSKWWDETLRGKKQFKAHLLGFRGVGSELGDPFHPEGMKRAFGTYGKGWCPAVVLRLEDGRKRCFTRGSFSNADQKYITELYVNEMNRIRKTLENLPRPTADGMKKTWPQGKIHEPGTFRVESQHFAVCAGSQSPVGSSSPWVDANEKKKTAQYRKATLGVFEDFWAYLEYAGQLMPHWNGRGDVVRYVVTVPGTMRDGFGEIGGYAGGGGGGCGIRHAAWNLLFHEWGHGVPSVNTWAIGGEECAVDTHRVIADPSRTPQGTHQADRPYKNLFHGAYVGGLAYMLLSDDPNWGYAFLAAVVCQVPDNERSPMHTLARLGRDRGLWKQGEAVRGVGDLMGQLAARFVEFDSELQAGMRQTFPAALHQFLYPLDREKGLYRCNMAEAPEPFGCNHILLKPDAGAKKITVDFRGHVDPATHSDWRVCIVAVDDKGKCRYSPLWNRGAMSMDIREGDQRYWLTVTATPTALSPIDAARGAVGLLYEKDYAYKYPYDVKLTGCRPGGPNQGVGVNANWTLTGPDYRHDMAFYGGPRGRCYDWPHPADTPEYARMKKHLDAIIAGRKAYSEKLLAPKIYPGGYDWWSNRIYYMHMLTSALPIHLRAQVLLDNAQGARHPNGGGWVARGCQVAPTAYVGPDSMVLDGARVLGNVILEDNAVVSGKDVVIKDSARIFGGAVVCGAAEVSGFARVSRNISNRKLHLVCIKEEAPDYQVGVVPDPRIQRTGPEQRRNFYRRTYAGLEANYGMDRSETVLLEDLFQERGRSFEELLCYDGVLYGQPGFEVDGERRGYTFNGKDQYAELAPMVADFAEITVEVALKPTGRAGQTLFDFGSSTDHCLKLLLSRAGKPTLVTVVDGKETSLSAPKLARGEWATLRIEIDGKTMTILRDNEKVASRSSTFRPLDVFPGGCVKRNFIAASRDGSKPFKGTLDHVRIFSVNHDDFEQDGIVPEISSRRLDPSFLERFKTFKALNAARLAAWEQTPEAKKGDEISAERFTRWQQEVKDINKEYDAIGKSVGGALREEVAALSKQQREAKTDEAKKALKQQLQRKTLDLANEERRAKMLHNADELYGIGAWGSWDFERALTSRMAAYKPFPVHEDEEVLQRVLDAQQGKWVTEIDWDSRLKFEKEHPFEELLPHQQRWLKRVKPYKYK